MRRSALAVLALSGWAAAYVMPAYSILKHMAQERDRMSLFLLRVDGSATFSGGAVKEAGPALGLPTDRPDVQVDATVYLKLPSRCRIELSSVEGGKQVAEVFANGKKRLEGPELSAVSVALQEVCALLAERSSSEADAHASVDRHLRALGVKEESTSLSRFGTQVAFVLGDLAEEQPQLWIYKDSFQPARVRFTDAQGAWDVRMLDYTSPATGEWFPRTLEVYRGGELELRFTALKGDSRGSIPEKLFQPPPQ
jgi:hypothetical protein